VFGLGWPEVLALVVIGLLVFGPEKLPQAAQQAGRWLRQLRNMANNARADLQQHLGPEFRNFDPADLNPKHFVRKHLLEDIERDWDRPSTLTSTLPPRYDDDLDRLDKADDPDDYGSPAPAQSLLAPGEIPPYDHEAT
jgi:twin arginine-targeting protein translocase TatB